MREADYLRQCLRQPHMMRQVDQRLRVQDQAIVSVADFTLPEDRALLEHLRRTVRERPVVTVEELCDSLDDVLLNRANALLQDEPDDEGTEPERLADSLAQLILDVRLERIRRLLAEVQQLFFEAKDQGQEDHLQMYKEQLQSLPLNVQRINRARWAMSAVSRRQAEEARHA
jgi:hypothetical protein